MSDADQSLAARITELESLLTHLQRTIHDLDQVVIEQQRQITALDRKFNLVHAELGVVRSGLAPELKPEDEKPPHY